MKNQKPILFSGAMMRAMLAGQKTQTRRICKSQPYSNGFHFGGGDIWCHNDYLPPSAMLMDYRDGGHTYTTSNMEGWDFCCPYGAPGDRLYVRETFYAYGRWESRFSEKKKREEWHFVDMTVECGHAYVYAADGAPHDFKKGNQRSDRTPSWWKRPAIHMPRRASRILLEITGVRVERLQDISEQDALAEEIEKNWTGDPKQGENGFGSIGWVPDCGWLNYMEDMDGDPAYTPQDSFRSLWHSINGRQSWAANPWVWVLEFRRITP